MMVVRKALEFLRETAETADSSHCPKHVGLTFNFCDFSENCDCKICWNTAIALYLQGVIEFDRFSL